jgi:HD-like signal output (HDOD) protein
MSDIAQQLQDITGLISLPEVFLKLRRLMDDDASDINDFAAVIIVDPNLSSPILKMVNSAYFGFPEPIDSITRAINMIGVDQLYNLALSVSAMSSLDLPNDILPLKPFWHRSLYTGVLSQQLALQLKLERSDLLFLAGLLHETGHLVLCARLPDYARESIRVSVQSGRSIHEVQHRMLGCHYGDIGAMLLGNWNLSEELQALVRYQPTPTAATRHRVETAVLHLARAYAGQNPVAVSAAADSLIAPEVRALIELDQDEINQSLEMARLISIDVRNEMLT